LLRLVAEGAALVFVHQSLWFAVSVRLGRNDVADIAWGLGFVFLSYYLVFSGATDMRDVLIATLVTLWGVRLSVYLALRNADKGEDFRYRKWREEWGERVLLISYLRVFLLQGAILLVIAIPLFVSAAEVGPRLDVWAALGTVLWTAGFLFETIGDAQLRRFKADPANRGRLMTTGLWGYTRHPNYFGEALLWWGIGVMVLPLPNGWLALLGPAGLTLLLLRVSGVPMLEKKYEGNPEFEAYRARTSAFFPLPPKS
jgi:steroid 5-alpha reductase family enzyme